MSTSSRLWHHLLDIGASSSIKIDRDRFISNINPSILLKVKGKGIKDVFSHHSNMYFVGGEGNLSKMMKACVSKHVLRREKKFLTLGYCLSVSYFGM